MKRNIIYPIVVVMLTAWMYGCNGAMVNQQREPGAISLDRWLETEAFDKIEEQLLINPSMRDQPFLIVKVKRENVEKKIDALTEDFRDRLIPRLRKNPNIKLVLRHPVSDMDRPYRFKDLKCDRFKDVERLLAVDIKKTGAPGDNLAWVSIGAMDTNEGAWVGGFSIYSEVALTPGQSRALDDIHPDDSLRGLKFLPYAPDQYDEMAGYLARNISCKFKDGYTLKKARVHVNLKKITRRDSRRIAKFLEKQLNYCNEILLVKERRNADWILNTEAIEVHSGSGLFQFWVDVVQGKTGQMVKGLSTHAYFKGDERQGAIDGKWKVRNLSTDRDAGVMMINRTSRGGYNGNLFKPDGKTARKLGIQINLSGNKVSWIYYDRAERKTYEANGVLLDDGNRMSVTVSNFPSSGESLALELTRVE